MTIYIVMTIVVVMMIVSCIMVYLLTKPLSQSHELFNGYYPNYYKSLSYLDYSLE